MNIFLETKRLILTVPGAEDFDALFEMQIDPDVMQYVGQGIRNAEQVKTGLDKAIEHFKKHGFSLCSVFEKESQQFVGRAGLIYLAYNDSQPDIEVGYALLKSFWGKGYATELTNALIDWGFSHLPINKLIAVIKPENEKSRRVAEKAKMHYRGRDFYWDNEVAVYEIYKPSIDFKHVKLIPATLVDYPAVQNMARFYVYDMSQYLGFEEGWQIPENGLYKCMSFQKYWKKENCFPFLIKFKNELTGFAIVDKRGSTSDIEFNMAQFFILRKFKNKGIGLHVAHQLFDKFRGLWEVMVIPGNEGAYRFWRTTIKRYTQNNYEEYSRAVKHFDNSKKNIFKFNSKLNLDRQKKITM